MHGVTVQVLCQESKMAVIKKVERGGPMCVVLLDAYGVVE